MPLSLQFGVRSLDTEVVFIQGKHIIVLAWQRLLFLTYGYSRIMSTTYMPDIDFIDGVWID